MVTEAPRGRSWWVPTPELAMLGSAAMICITIGMTYERVSTAAKDETDARVAAMALLTQKVDGVLLLGPKVDALSVAVPVLTQKVDTLTVQQTEARADIRELLTASGVRRK